MPCTPKMTGCKASCAHRTFVDSYREERLRQEMKLMEDNLGYDTEMKDAQRVLAEQGTPMITFQQWMIQNKRSPVAETETLDLNYGNQMAEESLLAMAMATPNALPYLRQLGPEEFHTALAHDIYVAILDLEDHGKRATPLAVEDYLQLSGKPSHPDWDSRMDQGLLDPEYRDRTMFGLHKWEYTAAPIILAPVFQEEIRTNHQAYQTERILAWGKEAMREVISDGPTQAKVRFVHQEVIKQMQSIKPAFSHPSASLTPARSQVKPQAAMSRSR